MSDKSLLEALDRAIVAREHYEEAERAQTGHNPALTAESAKSPLEELIIQHRIAITPEYESAIWHAVAYENDSAEPTGSGSGKSPSEAVRAALTAAQGNDHGRE